MSTPRKLDVADKFSFHLYNSYLCGCILDFGSDKTILFCLLFPDNTLVEFFSCCLSLVSVTCGRTTQTEIKKGYIKSRILNLK